LRAPVGMRRGEEPMARATIRRSLYLLSTGVVLASAVLAGTANWPKG
jgi:hypothetical protein